MVTQVQKPANQPNEPMAEQFADDLVAPPKRYSPEEYLEMEVKSDIRHEYRDGELIAMSGAMPNHNRITLNVASTLHFLFKSKPFEVFVTDQRLWIPQRRIYTYPDVIVIEGDLQLQEGRKDTAINPLLIVEVLSESTQDYDKGGKFDAYRTIPSFREYVLVDQYAQRIERYVKTGAKKWDFQEFDESDTVLQFVTLGLEIAIADLYDKVIFEPAELQQAE
jgi:Uma2 family endonuclease